MTTAASSDNLFASLKGKAAAAPETPATTTETPATEPVAETTAPAVATTVPAEPVATQVPEPVQEPVPTPAPVPTTAPATQVPAAPELSELDMLKQRAAMMGLKHSPNIGVDALRAKVQAKMSGERDPTETTEDQYVEKTTAPKEKTLQELREEMFAEQMKLVRVRVTNLNPTKKDLPGEIFTFANRILGSVRKFIPYGEATDNGYMIPFCIYTQLKEREFVNIRTRKDSRGRTIVETNMAREFALEVLDLPTEGELARLAAAQAAAGGID